MNHDFIDRIYEASFFPEMWPGILDELGHLTDAQGGLLFSARDKVLSWQTSDNLGEVFESYVKDGWFARCGRKVCMFSKAHASFLIENDYWSDQELETNEIYNDFFRPRGLGWSAGTGLLMPTGDQIVFSIERTLKRGPMENNYVETLNEFRPHLARSAMVSARLGLKSAQGAHEALDKLGLPTLLLDVDGTVIQSNSLADDLAGHVTTGMKNRICLTDRHADKLLKSAMEQLHTHPASTVHSFPLRDEDDQAALVAHLLPVSRSVHDLFARSYALLILSPVAGKNMPPVELLRSLFDLTAAEAKVARQLAKGHSLEDIAERGGVAMTTVRTQLRHVMEKTGCNRQAEVVALLSNLSVKQDRGEN